MTAGDRGYLIHKRPLTGRKYVGEFFLASSGRCSIVLSQSRQQPIPQSFTPLWVQYSGKSNLKRSGGIEAYAPSFALKNRALICGFYLNELLLKLMLDQDPATQLFSTYESTLQQLADGRTLARPLRAFELALLEQLGHSLSADGLDGSGQAIEPQLQYRWREKHGLTSDFKGSFSGQMILETLQQQWSCPEHLKQARILMQQMLNTLLNGRVLHSRKLLNHQV
ncbi:DNA repair protein RecO [Pelagibaculum spongiae]|uniref:DNA repair protein RecO n=1 Tax=Pelagibaculum spongiae TaxID=2080658 RepID=A0A2V1GWA4_9GAMM|nr:DNA repair protein RecO C-terminal domain-containing protein [Pelagibaculum spongiae]PVZ64932.1 hypothetical protein DC094_18895 [Pelagibaculum spongiae]